MPTRSRLLFGRRALLLLTVAALTLLGLPLTASPAQAATPAFTQVRAQEITSGTLNSLAFSSANTAGNLVVVYVIWDNLNPVSISDTRGNTYVSAGTRTSWGPTSRWSSQVFYAKDVAAGSNTVRATFSTAVTGWADMYIHEYSGIDRSDPLDATATGKGTSTAMNSGAASTTRANDLVFGAGASSAQVNQAGTGFTTRASNFGNRTEDRTATSAGSYSATARQNGSAWVMHMAAFKADTTTPADTTAPTVSVTAPAGGATVSGSVSVTASAADNVGVAGVQFLLDGNALGAEDTAAPYSVSWDTTTATTGAHVLTARARDAAGNTTTSGAVNVTIASADTTKPSVVITSPAANAQIVDIVNVTADADDNVGVAGVQFLVDGTASGVEDTTAPYVLAWDSRTATNGAHTLTARARDAAGNSAVSAPVTVNVSNTNRFQNEILATGFTLPTNIEFMPDGRMLVAELNGVIKVMSPPYTTPSPTPFLQIANVANTGVQQGVMDVALDPNFTANRYFYVFYTMGSPNRDRLSRFTANSTLTGTVAGSELPLYTDPLDANSEHHGGAILFDNSGKLFFTTGEHFDPSASQKLTSPRGKLHRINPDGSVPADNPFNDGAGSNVDSIWALGLRNPYRASYDSATDRIFIGDVGGNNASTAFEEVDLGARGANYGWPNVEGPCASPCTGPIYSYPHNGRDASITGGFVYHGSQFPSSYRGSYFFADYGQNWIKRLTFDANGAVSGVSNFEPADGMPDGPYGDIVYLTEGPDGALYYVDLGYDDESGTSGVSKIRRIRYLQSNQAPIAVASGTPTSGPAPLAVAFSSDGSSDPEGAPLSYQWDFGDTTSSTAASPTHTYTRAGKYTVRLTVSDGTNSTISTPLTISVGGPPTASISSPTDGSFFVAGDVIQFAGDGSDPDDGALPASAFTWNIDFLHEGHVHPGTPITGVRSGSFTIPTTGHDFEGNTRYRITLTVTDSNGLTATQAVTVYPTKVNLSFSTAPDSGLTLYVDGIAHTAPFVVDTLVGFRHNVEARDQTSSSSSFTFASWSDGGAQQHDIVVPATDQSYSATFTRPTAPPPIGFVQLAYAAPQSSPTSVTVNFPNAQTAGNANVVVVGWNSATGTISSVTDAAGNVYSLAAPLMRGSNLSQAIYYVPNIKAAAAGNTVTVRFSGASLYPDIRVAEYTGLDPVAPPGAASTGTGSSTTASSGPVTTTWARSLVFAAGTTWGYYSNATGGFTTRVITQPNFDIVADRVVTAPGTYTATAPVTANPWILQAVAFKGAGQ